MGQGVSQPVSQKTACCAVTQGIPERSPPCLRRVPQFPPVFEREEWWVSLFSAPPTAAPHQVPNFAKSPHAGTGPHSKFPSRIGVWRVVFWKHISRAVPGDAGVCGESGGSLSLRVIAWPEEERQRAGNVKLRRGAARNGVPELRGRPLAEPAPGIHPSAYKEGLGRQAAAATAPLTCSPASSCATHIPQRVCVG